MVFVSFSPNFPSTSTSLQTSRWVNFKCHILITMKYFLVRSGYLDRPRPSALSWSSRSGTSCAGSSSASRLCSSYKRGSCRRRTGKSGSGSASFRAHFGWPWRWGQSKSRADGPASAAPPGWRWTASPGRARRSQVSLLWTAAASRRRAGWTTPGCCRAGRTQRSWRPARWATGTGLETMRNLRGRSLRVSVRPGGSAGGTCCWSCRSRQLPCPGPPGRL